MIRQSLILLLASLIAPAAMASDDDLPIRTFSVEGQFADVLDAVKNAIVGRGINIAHTLPASDMLSRTGPDLGFQQQPYLHAESVEFCSAKLSHELAAIHPSNLVLCPFTIGIYVTPDEPETVKLAYRVPVGLPGSEEVAAKVGEFVESLIVEVTDW